MTIYTNINVSSSITQKISTFMKVLENFWLPVRMPKPTITNPVSINVCLGDSKLTSAKWNINPKLGFVNGSKSYLQKTFRELVLANRNRV